MKDIKQTHGEKRDQRRIHASAARALDRMKHVEEEQRFYTAQDACCRRRHKPADVDLDDPILSREVTQDQDLPLEHRIARLRESVTVYESAGDLKMVAKFQVVIVNLLKLHAGERSFELAQAHWDLANTYLRLGSTKAEAESALDHCMQAIFILDGFNNAHGRSLSFLPYVLTAAAVACTLLGRLKEALRLANRAVKLCSERAEEIDNDYASFHAYRTRARILMKLKRSAKAVDDFRLACASGIGNASEITVEEICEEMAKALADSRGDSVDPAEAENEALQLYEKAYLLRKRRVGSARASDTALAAGTMAMKFHRHEKADELFGFALTDLEFELGNSHPKVESVRKARAMAQIYANLARKDFEKALQQILECAKVEISTHGPTAECVGDSLVLAASTLQSSLVDPEELPEVKVKGEKTSKAKAGNCLDDILNDEDEEVTGKVLGVDPNSLVSKKKKVPTEENQQKKIQVLKRVTSLLREAHAIYCTSLGEKSKKARSVKKDLDRVQSAVGTEEKLLRDLEEDAAELARIMASMKHARG
eukprot:Rmarinus@m.11541